MGAAARRSKPSEISHNNWAVSHSTQKVAWVAPLDILLPAFSPSVSVCRFDRLTAAILISAST
jgi:hypothetical protein